MNHYINTINIHKRTTSPSTFLLINSARPTRECVYMHLYILVCVFLSLLSNFMISKLISLMRFLFSAIPFPTAHNKANTVKFLHHQSSSDIFLTNSWYYLSIPVYINISSPGFIIIFSPLVSLVLLFIPTSSIYAHTCISTLFQFILFCKPRKTNYEKQLETHSQTILNFLVVSPKNYKVNEYLERKTICKCRYITYYVLYTLPDPLPN